MKYIGAHVAAEPELSAAPREAAALGATAFSMFTALESKWRAPDPTPEQCEAFRRACEECGFTPAQILPHAGFLINLASPDKRKLALSRLAFEDEMRRCHLLGLSMLNFHPGATLKKVPDEEALDVIAVGINRALAKVPDVKAVIENTAGQGSNLGWDFAQIARIIDGIEDKSRVGVCIDTCHAFAAGYDLATADGYARCWDEFDKLIGREYLSAMHLNDALRPRGSRIDRHASIGQGEIGVECFRRLLADSRTDNIPLILETPDPRLWRSEITQLYGYSLKQNS